ncbi:mobile element transfer protein [Streptomyces sp. WAC00469]|nr:mobile element transfer protein [Streptomyces sp. WAC00469]
MPATPRFRRVVRIGPVQVATYYDSRAAAELAARTHRCAVR